MNKTKKNYDKPEKFTRSVDGIDRCSIRYQVDVRLTEEEFKRYNRYAITTYGVGLREYLDRFAPNPFIALEEKVLYGEDNSQ